jgi:hypothetical protein
MLLIKELNFVQEGIMVSHCTSLRGRQEVGCIQFTKLTDEDVILCNIKKMKTNNCTQVFCHKIDMAMHVAARVSTELSAESVFYINFKATETADLLFFDKFFDSVNNSFKHLSPGK